MAEVLQLPGTDPAVPLAERPMPDRLSEVEVRRLLRLAARDRFTVEQTRYAVERVRGWCAGRGRKAWRVDWVMVILNGMREGWALAGFEGWWQRRTVGQEDPRQRQITPQLIDEIVRRQDA